MALTLPKASDIKAKLGPFPVWVWGVIVGGIVLIVVYYRNNAAKAAAAGTDASGVTVSGEDLTAALGATGSGDSGATTAPDATTSSSLGSTNTTWESSAVAWLASHGFSPLTAQNAIENYLNGTLSATDPSANAAVNAAITNYGLPPEGVFGIPAIPVVTTPAPATTTAASAWYQLSGAPGHQTIYKVSSGKRVSQSSAQWKAAGSPHLTTISAANLNKISKP